MGKRDPDMLISEPPLDGRDAWAWCRHTAKVPAR